MKKFLLVFFSFAFVLSAWAQDRVVTGKVTSSEDGLALPGVNIVLKGTTSGTVTDVGGVFKLSVPAAGGTLIFSFIGLKTQEVPIGDRSTVDISLAQDVASLQEVVVTGIGITRETRELGYSVAKVGNELINQAQVTNVAAALSAKVSGLQINQTDNSVNGGVRVVLRGNRSFLGNNQALVVLDGVQVSSDFLNSLNPNDIDNVVVLKGANAAALYGSSASNGVLVINTKLGKKGPPEITFTTTTQLDRVSYLPKLQTGFGQNGGEGPGTDVFNLNPSFPAQYVAYENQNYGPPFNGQLVQLGRPLQHPVMVNGQLEDTQYTTYSSKYNDHLKFFNTGVTEQNALTFAAGDATSHYYISVQDVNKTGVLPGDKFRRDVIRLNGDKEYGAFKISYQVSYTLSHTDVNFTPGGTTAGNAPNSVYWMWMNTAMNVPLTQYKDWKNNIWASPNGWYDDFYGNPYWSLANNRKVANKGDLVGNLTLSLQPTKWLGLKAIAGFTNSAYHETDNSAPLVYDLTLANLNRYSVAQTITTGGIVPGSTADTYTAEKVINTDFMATISHKITEDLSFKLIGGMNIRDDFYTANTISAASLVYSDPQIYNVAYRNGNLGGGSSISRLSRFSVYADGSITYKYLSAHGSWRQDQTSLLAASNRTFSYPEADVSFIFTDAIPALKDNQFLNFGKITGSIAKVGNVSLVPYQLQTVINAGTPYSGTAGSVPVMYLGPSVVSSNIKPEFTLSKEVTLELGMWDEKVNFKVAAYQTNTTNQTVPIGTSNTTGYTSALINCGEMLNKGLEFDLSVTPIRTASGFKWTLGGNYTFLSTKVMSIFTSASGDVLTSVNVPDGSLNATNSYAVVGQQYPVLKTTDWVRDPQGHVIVDPVTGLPSRDPTIKNLGQTNPKYRLGLSSNWSFKGISLSVLFDYRGGNVIYNQIGNNIDFGGIGYTSASAGRQRFVYPNSVVKNPDGSFTPNKSVTVNDGNYNFWQGIYNTVGSNYVTSAAFWKLREISLGYQIPRFMLEKTKVVKAARISVNGRNLFMWRPKSNKWTDPEFATDTSNANGTTTAFQTPPVRTYGATLMVTF